MEIPRIIGGEGGVRIENDRDPMISRPLDGLVILGTVKGLVKDAAIAERIFMETSPKAVALHISPEELKGLEAVVKGKIKEVPLSSYEMVYAKKLSVFGEVQVPSPALVTMMKSAKKHKIPVLPLDMDEETYSEVYIRTIGGLSMVWTSLRLKRVNRKKFKAGSPEEFSLQWDRYVNRKTYQRLERLREEHMAEEIKKFLTDHKPLLCIVEVERFEGIIGSLQRGH